MLHTLFHQKNDPSATVAASALFCVFSRVFHSFCLMVLFIEFPFVDTYAGRNLAVEIHPLSI